MAYVSFANKNKLRIETVAQLIHFGLNGTIPYSCRQRYYKKHNISAKEQDKLESLAFSLPILSNNSPFILE